MSLTSVKLSEDIHLTCLTHALSTETEEIMGLLLGDIEYSKDGGVTAMIWGASPQPRSDRQKDRVETNPEQLAAASAQAERMTIASGKTTRVIGWYHSHPHITVLPSHVDVRTQAMYQLLDPGFVGLIYSCFNEDAKKVGRIQVLAFQASNGKPSSTPTTTTLVLANNQDSVVNVESSLSASDSMCQRSSSSAQRYSPEQDTSDTASTSGSRTGGRASDFGAFFVNNAEANIMGRDGTSGNYSSGTSVVEIDPIEMSESMQEAMLLSTMEPSGGEYVRKEVPLHIVPTLSLIQLDHPLASFVDLQRVLFEEEKAAYRQSIQQITRDGKVHPLAFVHNTSTYHATLCRMMEHCLAPAINVLEDRLRENKMRLALLKEEEEELEAQERTRAERSREPSSPVQGSGGQSEKDPKDISH